MDIAISAGLQVGIQALKILNRWLHEEEIAKTWYGKSNYKIFTRRRYWLIFYQPWKFGGREIQRVFRIKKDAWHKVIQNCLTDCYSWHQRMKENCEGECCWLLLYQSLPNETQTNCLEKSQRSLSSIGIITSLPAARVDSWGLVVMALANGAKIEATNPPDGACNFSRLDAQYFVLTIWQNNVAGPITAHIEPKEHPSECRSLTSPEWNNLLWYGHSFGEHDHIFGWPLLSKKPPEPPNDLVSDIRNEELSRLVIDNMRVKRLRDQLREAIYDCHDEWDNLKSKVQSDIDLRDQITDIQQNLRRLKLVLVDEEQPDETPYLQEQRPEDTLHYAEEQLKLVQNKVDERHVNLVIAKPGVCLLMPHSRNNLTSDSQNLV